MIKKINKVDLFFILALIAGLIFHISTVFFVHIYSDETFYYTIPFRLINGDSLVQHEWHLSQFSSLFSYLPVRIFTMLKGSTEGIIVLMRCVYILIHTAMAVVIYRFFKEYRAWAIAAAMMFYTQVSYAIYAISYHSMFAVFILLFSFCLLSAVKKNSEVLCIGAGFCFGACCVCNPIIVFAFAGYAILCALWTRKDKILQKISVKLEAQNSKFSNMDFDWIQFYGSIFSGKAFLFSLSGIGIMAIICIVFFFSTGGTITSLIQNAGNLLNSSEYDFFENSFGQKVSDLWMAMSQISFKLPFLLPLFFVGIIFDRNRRESPRRMIYMLSAFAISVLHAFGILFASYSVTCVFSLPFAIFSTVCYILTERKNKVVFYCVWCPCTLGAAINCIVSNTLLSSAGVVLAVSNVAGVVFVRDLFCEICSDSKKRNETKEKYLYVAARGIICISLCLQMMYYGFAIYSFKDVENTTITAEKGPLAGMLMRQEQHNRYLTVLSDLDTVRERSGYNEPFAALSNENWMYLYIDRPFGVFTTWAQALNNPESMIAYYKANSDRIPKYIYISKTDLNGTLNNFYEDEAKLVRELFSFTEEELPGGILLTVTECKFDTVNKTE